MKRAVLAVLTLISGSSLAHADDAKSAWRADYSKQMVDYIKAGYRLAAVVKDDRYWDYFLEKPGADVVRCEEYFYGDRMQGPRCAELGPAPK